MTARFCAVIARCCSTAPRSQAPCGNLRSTDGGPHSFAQRAETAHEFGFQPSAPELLTSPYTMQWASRAKNAGSKTALGKKVSTDDTRQTNQSVTCGLPPNPIRQRHPPRARSRCRTVPIKAMRSDQLLPQAWTTPTNCGSQPTARTVSTFGSQQQPRKTYLSRALRVAAAPSVTDDESPHWSRLSATTATAGRFFRRMLRWCFVGRDDPQVRLLNLLRRCSRASEFLCSWRFHARLRNFNPGNVLKQLHACSRSSRQLLLRLTRSCGPSHVVR